MRGTGGQTTDFGAVALQDYEFSTDRASSRWSPDSSTDQRLESRGLSTISPQIAGFFGFACSFGDLTVHSP